MIRLREKRVRLVRWLSLWSVLLLLCQASHGLETDRLTQEGALEMQEFAVSPSGPLFVPPQDVQGARDGFVSKLRRSDKNKRVLFEDYIAVIGANGILDGIETVWPRCHSEAHDLGKIIFSKVRDIGTSLRVCADRCYSGCMHGVLMEAFKDVSKLDSRRLNLVALKPAMKDLCARNEAMTASYSPGDCAHGVGHALMFLAGYETPHALQACAEFGNPAMEYYCATGAYMEYVSERDPEDAVGRSFLYPCDTYDYPAACARYKMVHVVRRSYSAGKTMESIRQLCETVKGSVRLGCYHGFGNGHMLLIAAGRLNIRDVCLNLGEVEEFVCIEGAMERMAKFHGERAVQVCRDLAGRSRQTCENAVAQKMYSMTKDLTVYLTR